MKPIRVDALKVIEFRSFHNQEIRFHKRITMLTGQNGTAKSTVLGMLAQPFSFGSTRRGEGQDASAYITTYHGERLQDYLDISGRQYAYECDQVFRLSKKYDTPTKRYIYETILSGIDFEIELDSKLKGKKLLTVRQPRGETLRFVTGPGQDESISHKAGEGNFPHPVIYLSLGRLLPLAEVKECKIAQEDSGLSEEEGSWYVSAYKKIFSLFDEMPTSGVMDAANKRVSVVPIDTYYDGESCSAGQDNVGRILTALLSFRRLKKSLSGKYRGGLLLIDEIDATLHPAAQFRMMEVIHAAAEELDLQVVVTTHSLHLLERCSKSRLSKDVGVVRIRKFSSGLTVESVRSIDDVLLDLKNEARPPVRKARPEKVSVVVEDAVAASVVKYLVKKTEGLSRSVQIANVVKNKGRTEKIGNLSGNYLEILANNAKKLPILKKLVIMPDGDMAVSGKWASNPDSDNVLPLPGKRPMEAQMFELLRNDVADDDAFWSECKGENYGKRTAIGEYTDLNIDDIDGIKKWFKKQTPFWGYGNSIAYEKYYKTHKDECDTFLQRFETIVRRIQSMNG